MGNPFTQYQHKTFSEKRLDNKTKKCLVTKYVMKKCTSCKHMIQSMGTDFVMMRSDSAGTNLTLSL